MKPEVTLNALIPGFNYFAFWYVLGAVAFWLIGMETRGRTIDEIDSALSSRAGADLPSKCRPNSAGRSAVLRPVVAPQEIGAELVEARAADLGHDQVDLAAEDVERLS